MRIQYSVKIKDAEIGNPFTEIPWEPSKEALNKIAAIIRAEQMPEDAWMYTVKIAFTVHVHMITKG